MSLFIRKSFPFLLSLSLFTTVGINTSVAQEQAVEGSGQTPSSKQLIQEIKYQENQNEILIDVQSNGSIAQDAITTDLSDKDLILIEIKNTVFEKVGKDGRYWLKSFDVAKNDPYIKGVMLKQKENAVQFRIRFKNQLPDQILEQILFEKNQGQLMIKVPRKISSKDTDPKADEPAQDPKTVIEKEKIPVSSPVDAQPKAQAQNLDVPKIENSTVEANRSENKTADLPNVTAKVENTALPTVDLKTPAKTLDDKLKDLKNDKIPNVQPLETTNPIQANPEQVENTEISTNQDKQDSDQKDKATEDQNQDSSSSQTGSQLDHQWIFLGLAFVFFGVAALMWFKGKRFSLNTNNDINIDIIASKMLSPQQRLFVVEVLGQKVLVGSTESQISFIKLTADAVDPLNTNDRNAFFARDDDFVSDIPRIDTPRPDRTEKSRPKIDTLNQRGHVDRSVDRNIDRNLDRSVDRSVDRDLRNQSENIRYDVNPMPTYEVDHRNPLSNQNGNISYNAVNTDYVPPMMDDRSFVAIPNPIVSDLNQNQQKEQDVNEDDLLEKIRQLNGPKA